MSKKTDQSLDGLKGIGNLFKGLSEVMEGFGEKSQSMCSAFKSKKLKDVEGTVKAAVLATITEVETSIVAPFERLSDDLKQVWNLISPLFFPPHHRDLTLQASKLSKGVDQFVSEREKSRKRMLNDASALRKDWDKHLSELKKTKENYHKLAKDYAKAQAASKGISLFLPSFLLFFFFFIFAYSSSFQIHHNCWRRRDKQMKNIRNS